MSIFKTLGLYEVRVTRGFDERGVETEHGQDNEAPTARPVLNYCATSRLDLSRLCRRRGSGQAPAGERARSGWPLQYLTCSRVPREFCSTSGGDHPISGRARAWRISQRRLAAWLVSCNRVSLTKSGYTGQDLFGGFSPDKGLAASLYFPR
jgi:hypothetical protein